ncbi:BatD family protein [Endozoicomonas ascidiicola]|uniref:BatD family protein n=1 Tax=Endozoicomonas ascidiicola TaxID=1698521 RepID=UPI00082A43D7|nr:BatD family protein [Endozoicomonas ascidiicola]
MVGHSSRTLSITFVALSLLLSLFISVGASADFTASVNRTTIAPHESLELTLQTDESTDEAPDLSTLEFNFDVLGTRQHSQTSYTNGKMSYSRKWIITLIPKQEGTVVIPPVSLGKEKSQPISITVTKQNTQDPSMDDSPLFMKAEVSDENIYIQQELLLTVQIFYRIQLYDDKRLSSLDLDNALVQQLGEAREFDSIISGIRYRTIELKYTIHPQSAGELIIPPLTFTGTAAETQDPFGSFFSRSGRPVTARSAELKINVKPSPDNYPASDAWLPARNLTLQEQWSQPLDTLKVGDAITRTITVNADGLSAAQLPPILMPQPEGVNSYPDKSSTEDRETANGIRGQRTDSIAMIPTRSGTITLPVIEYTWFDTTSGDIKTTSLPETTITVAPSKQPIAPVINQPSTTAVQTPSINECPKPTPVSADSSDSSLLLWQILSGVFALLWLITLGLWRFKQPTSKTETCEQITTHNKKINSEELPAFEQLAAACQKEDASQALNELKNWSRLYLNKDQLHSLADSLKLLGSSKLETICNALSESRYSTHQKTVDIQNLLTELIIECRRIRDEKPPEKVGKSLGKLYPE